MSDELKSTLFSVGKPSKKPDEPITEDDTPDVGPCAAIAKTKWVTALSIKHHDGRLESFQYSGLMVHSEYQPGGYWVRFVDADEKIWRVDVKGRNLEMVYTLTIQRRLEWIRKIERDFGTDKQPVITAIEISEEKA